jgi:hypothetical protein
MAKHDLEFLLQSFKELELPSLFHDLTLFVSCLQALNPSWNPLLSSVFPSIQQWQFEL